MPPITLPAPSRRAEAFAHDLLSARAVPGKDMRRILLIMA
jgi:hypothetical protein